MRLPIENETMAKSEPNRSSKSAMEVAKSAKKYASGARDTRPDVAGEANAKSPDSEDVRATDTETANR